MSSCRHLPPGGITAGQSRKGTSREGPVLAVRASATGDKREEEPKAGTNFNIPSGFSIPGSHNPAFGFSFQKDSGGPWAWSRRWPGPEPAREGVTCGVPRQVRAKGLPLGAHCSTSLPQGLHQLWVLTHQPGLWGQGTDFRMRGARL